jgi:esterase
MQLHFQEYGQGEPVIILHGLFGSSTNWQSIGRKLAGQYHVFAVDQRNHGNSPHAGQMDYGNMADDILDFMEQHGLRETNVLGHSMGGKTAMQLALSHPARVQRLVIVDIAPRRYPPAHDEILQALTSLDPPQFQSRKQMEAALAIPDLRTRQFLLMNVARDETGRFHWKFGLENIQRNYDRLNDALTLNSDRQFDKPTLVLRGEKSDYVREEDFTLIRSLFPRAEFRTVPGAGHWIHADNPEAFLKIVSEFLADRASEPATSQEDM